MKKTMGLLFSAGLGAGLMYLFDPERGKRRRALMRDKAVHTANKATDTVNKFSEDMMNRTRGLGSELRARMKREPVEDSILVERIRAAIGRLTSHPSAIQVEVQEGQVTLSGPILADEAQALIDRVENLRGVAGVVDQLERHAEAGSVPGLQGEPAGGVH
ncbi:MAG: BON domain-containing protein [Pseudomonadota bacterium]